MLLRRGAWEDGKGGLAPFQHCLGSGIELCIVYWLSWQFCQQQVACAQPSCPCMAAAAVTLRWRFCDICPSRVQQHSHDLCYTAAEGRGSMSHATIGFVLEVLWEPFSAVIPAGVGKDVHEIVRAL